MLNTELKILTYPHPILTTPSMDIDIMGPNRKEYIQFIGKMEEMYLHGPGWGEMVGLAAPQVGKNWNIFIAFGEAFINPVIEPSELKGFSHLQEGCYSLKKDKFDYPTTRWWEVRCSWVDVNGEKHTKKFRGHQAQIVQHEYDHLQGKLCIDHGNIN